MCLLERKLVSCSAISMTFTSKRTVSGVYSSCIISRRVQSLHTVVGCRLRRKHKPSATVLFPPPLSPLLHPSNPLPCNGRSYIRDPEEYVSDGRVRWSSSGGRGQMYASKRSVRRRRSARREFSLPFSFYRPSTSWPVFSTQVLFLGRLRPRQISTHAHRLRRK